MFSLFSYAHEIRPAYLKIQETQKGTLNVIWKVPERSGMVPKINPILEDVFKENEIKENFKKIGGSYVKTYVVNTKYDIHGKNISIEGLSKTLIDVLIIVEFKDGEYHTFLLQPDHPEITIPEKETFINTAKTYFVLGVEHILLGIDHLLFVWSLILITVGFSKLFKTVTAFTIAHSITLSLSALGFLGLPGVPVEAVIALSIVFLALELVKFYRGEEVLTAKYPWVVAFTFGLLHGFGFAGALSDIGLPQMRVVPALLFFNVGVEVGQLIFIGVVFIFIWMVGKFQIKKKLKGRLIISYMIGGIASFWFIERLLKFF